MQQTVNNDEHSSFLKRFYEFNDTVIRSIKLIFSDDGTRGMELLMSAQDSMVKGDDKWVSVTIFVDNISEMAIREQAQTTIQVISHGLHILIVENQFGLEFGGAVENLDSFSTLQESDAFVIGKELSFEVSPY